MPITPSCQPSPAATSTRSPRSSAPLRSISAAAARRIVSSTCWRSRLRPSSCSASGWASSREAASSRSSASVGSPSRPAALMRGARRKLRSDVRRRAGSTPALDISARRPGRSASRETPQPAPHERAVLVGQRYDVGDRGQRDEIGELVERGRQRRRIAAVAARPQRLCELEHDAGAAQVGERIGRAGGRARGHDRRIRENVAGAVMVGHDDVEPELARPRDRLGCRDAAVDGQQQPGAGQRERIDARNGHAVAVLEAVRQEGLDLGAQQAQHLDAERRRAHAVDVVVAVHDDAAAGGDRALDERAGVLHVAQRERVVQRTVAVQERPRDAGLGQTAPDQHLRRDALDAELGRERAHAVGAAGRDRERRGHPANLGPGPDAALSNVRLRSARAGCGRAPRAAAARAPGRAATSPRP